MEQSKKQIDQFDRPRPTDALDAGDPSSSQSVDETLDLALTQKGSGEADSPETSATYGAITNMDALNEDNWADLPETDPFRDDER